MAIEKYKDHPSIKMINENFLFETRFSFKDVSEKDIQKRFLIWTPRKQGHLEILPQKYLRNLQKSVT